MTIEELLAHPRYHTDKIGKDITKGCDVEIDKTSGKYEGHYKLGFCLTHGVIIYSCGWERGWHDGTESKPMIVKRSSRSEYYKYYYEKKKIKSNVDANQTLSKIQS